ncbi:amidase [Enterococcus sp. LJL90]
MKDGLYWVNQFKTGAVAPAEFYQQVDKKIQTLNPQLNALISWDLAQAKKDFAQGNYNETQTFYGLPIPLKILGQEKKGWPATLASQLFKNNLAQKTSNFTQKIIDSGLVPAGQSNSPEFGFKNITDPELYGVTRNPWNLEHSPGGSSGGAAAAVASGIFPIAGASDGGGSIRIPASFSGLIGLKPTRGAMPTGPGQYRGWQGASIDFALTVSMRDTEHLFLQLRGNPKAAPYHPPKDEWQDTRLDRSFKIAFLTESPVGTPVSDEAITATKKMAAELQQQGHSVTEIAYPVDGVALMESYYLMNGAETAAMFSGISKQLGKALTQKDMELITWGLYQYGTNVPVEKYIQALQLWDSAAEAMEKLFSDYDLLLTPTTAFPAPRIDQELQSDSIRQQLSVIEGLSVGQQGELIYQMFEPSLTLSPFTQLANLTGQPAISLPTHVTKDSLPLGVQFMASKGQEDLLLQIGYQLEAQDLFKLPAAYQ